MPILRFFLGLMVKKNNPQPLPSKHVFTELLTKKKTDSNIPRLYWISQSLVTKDETFMHHLLQVFFSLVQFKTRMRLAKRFVYPDLNKKKFSIIYAIHRLSKILLMGTLTQPDGTWLNRSVTHEYHERLVWSDEAAKMDYEHQRFSCLTLK